MIFLKRLQVSQFCSQSLAKWFATECLQQAKLSDANN